MLGASSPSRPLGLCPEDLHLRVLNHGDANFVPHGVAGRSWEAIDFQLLVLLVECLAQPTIFDLLD